MFTPLSTLPPTARIWIYQASRNLSAEEAAEIEQKAVAFARGWAAHGAALKASAQVLHGAFLVLAADEEAQGASGCSIDSSAQFVRQLEADYGLSFLDRTQLAFLKQGQVVRVPLAGIRAAINDGVIAADTPYFDTQAGRKAELEKNWPKPASGSWLAKYFESTVSK